MSLQRFVTVGLGALLALLLLPAHCFAQRPPLTSKQKRELAIATELDMDSQELVTLEKETARALSQNSSSFFSRVYSDDYVGIAASGEVLDKRALVASIQRSPAKYFTFLVTDISVRIYGASAVVTATWTTRGVLDGSNFSLQYRVIHVFVNTNGQGTWRAVAGQETLLPG